MWKTTGELVLTSPGAVECVCVCVWLPTEKGAKFRPQDAQDVPGPYLEQIGNK